jgi:hypothetical protein
MKSISHLPTMKAEMWKRFTIQDTHVWIDMLEDLLESYNNKTHTSIKNAPVFEVERLKLGLLSQQRTWRCTSKNTIKYKIGDTVKVSRLKGVFEKGYLANWSEEVFFVNGIKIPHSACDPIIYNLKDYNGEEIKGSFYAEELQKAKYGDVFLVEEVLRERGGKVLVKWLGWPKKYNEWVMKKDLK